MKGCFSKFPKHSFVKIQEKLADKQREYSAKSWNLPSWDIEILDAINAFADGTMPEHQAKCIIGIAESKRNNFQNKKYGRR